MKITLLIILCALSNLLQAQTLYVPSGTGGIGTSTVTGKVGLGTATPQMDFEITGTGTFGLGQIIRNSGTSSTSYTTLRLYNNMNTAQRALEIDYSGSSYGSPLITGAPSGESASITTTGAFPLSLGSANTARMIIAGNGNVGFGTVTPADQVEVVSGMRKVGLNTVIPGVANGGLLTLSRPDDGKKILMLGSSVAPDDDPVIYGQGGATETRFVSGSSYGFGFYTNITSVISEAQGFSARAGLSSNLAMKIASNGNVGIGTSVPNHKLTVFGTIYSKEVKVDLSVPGPDYVFDEDYDLPSLSEVASYIRQNKHLPEVPAATEMEKNGIDLGAMNMLLLKKVEELTLYMIQQQNLIDVQSKRIADLEEQIKK